MISSQRLADSVRRTLRDDFSFGEKSYTDEELAEYVNRAVPFIVSLDSSASIKTADVELIEGVYQALPTGGQRLVKVITNNVSDLKERIDGRLFSGKSAPKVLPLSTISSQNREWANSRATTIATTIVFNKDDPKSFMVYPPNNGSGKLMATYSYVQEAITALDSTEDVELSERYFNAIMYHMMYSCLTRDGEDSSNSKRAMSMYQMSVAELTGIAQNDIADTEPETVRA